MSKIVIIGIIIAVIIGIGVTSSTIGNSENENPQSEQVPSKEVIPVEESIEMELEQKGKIISLELTESIGITSP